MTIEYIANDGWKQVVEFLRRAQGLGMASLA